MDLKIPAEAAAVKQSSTNNQSPTSSKMNKQIITKDDGRKLIFYSFAAKSQEDGVNV